MICLDDQEFRCPECYGDRTSIPKRGQSRLWHHDPDLNIHNRGCMLDPDIPTKGYKFKGRAQPIRFMEGEQKGKREAVIVKDKERRIKRKAEAGIEQVRQESSSVPVLAHLGVVKSKKRFRYDDQAKGYDGSKSQGPLAVRHGRVLRARIPIGEISHGN